MGVLKFVIIKSTGNIDSDLSSGERVPCEWTDGTQETSTTGAFEAVANQEYIFYQDNANWANFKVIIGKPRSGFLPSSTIPAENSTVDDITSVVFTFPIDKVYRKGGKIVSFYNEDGEEVTGDFIYQDGDNSVIVRPKCISRKGTYRVVFPANSVGDAVWYNGGCEEGKGISNPEFEIKIYVTGRFSLVPESWEPQQNSVLDYHGDVVKVIFSEPVFVVGNQKAVIYKNAGYDDPVEATMKVSADDSKVVEIAYDTKLIPNHKYYFIEVPSGAISNVANGSGSCNPQLKYNFTTSIGDIDYVITFTVRKPENAQTDALNSIELEASHDWSVFAEDVLDKVFLYKHGTTEIASTLSKFEFDRSPGSTDFRTVFIDLSKTITETGRYDLVIPQGVLGGENWYLGKEGIANQAQTIVFTVGDPGDEPDNPDNPDDPKDGISSVDSENNPTFDVYTLTGILVARDATEAEISTLPAGIYFAKGRKFIVK